MTWNPTENNVFSRFLLEQCSPSETFEQDLSQDLDRLLIDCRLDMESENITKFFSFERRITSIASNRAYNSALKMLAVSCNRTHLVLSRWTTAAATLLPSLEPSVNMR